MIVVSVEAHPRVRDIYPVPSIWLTQRIYRTFRLSAARLFVNILEGLHTMQICPLENKIKTR
jgi:hypothetical protein